MKYSEIKKVKEFCNSLFSTPDWREVVEAINNGETDFEVDDVRFITSDTILEVLEDELAADEYTLGCFNASAISEATGWPMVLIEAAQKGEQFEEIGKAMNGEHIAALAELYARYDGYGAHFNSWNGGEDEITINEIDFYVFDNH